MIRNLMYLFFGYFLYRYIKKFLDNASGESTTQRAKRSSNKKSAIEVDYSIIDE